MTSPLSLSPNPRGKRAVLNELLISKCGSPSRIRYSLPHDELPARDLNNNLPSESCRDALADFPLVSEGEVMRHFTRLSLWNLRAATTLHPLGSCTMKYNPVVSESMPRLHCFLGYIRRRRRTRCRAC